MSASIKIDKAHELAVRDADFSRTNGNLIATGGDDCCMCVWDIRQPQESVIRVSAHSHWVWQSKFNPFHDALIATGGSDTLVQLWNILEDSDDESEGQKKW